MTTLKINRRFTAYLTMRAIRIAAALAMVAIGLVAFGQYSPASSDDRHALLVRIDGKIDTSNARYLGRSIEKAAGNDAEILIVKLDTPGGALKATRDMVGSLLNAEVPVVVHVSPPGAHAASAGTFVTAAANFAVMAPGTNIGSATPVSGTGKDLPETLGRKITEDTRAFIRSIADVRGRNAAALEMTVARSVSYSAQQAVELGIVDFISSDQELLANLNGRTVTTAAGPVTLRTEDIETRDLKKTWHEHFFAIVGNPNVALVLASVGFLLIVIEVFVPGSYVPSALGAVLLGLAIAGTGQLPATWVGIGFLALGVLLIVIEMHVHETPYNAMGVGGVVSFIVGCFLAFGGFLSTPDIPEVGVRASLWLLGTVSVIFAALVWGFIRVARPTGSSGAYGPDKDEYLGTRLAVATTDLTPDGTVLFDGEEWRATTNLSEPIQEGEAVLVEGVYGGVVKVSKLKSSDRL